MYKNIMFMVSFLGISAMHASDNYTHVYPQPAQNPYNLLPAAPPVELMELNSVQRPHVPLTYDQLIQQYPSEETRLSALDREMQKEYSEVCASALSAQQQRAKQMTQAMKNHNNSHEDCSCCCCCCCQTYVPKFDGISALLLNGGDWYSRKQAVLNQFSSPALHKAKKMQECISSLHEKCITSEEDAQSCIKKLPQNPNTISIKNKSPLFSLIMIDKRYYNGSNVPVESPYRVKVLDVAVEQGMDLTQSTVVQNNVLHLASTASLGLTKAVVGHLHRKGFLSSLLEQRNKKGETPLTYFVKYVDKLPVYKIKDGKVEACRKIDRRMLMARYLLNLGAKPDAIDNEGKCFNYYNHNGNTSLQAAWAMHLQDQQKLQTQRR